MKNEAIKSEIIKMVNPKKAGKEKHGVNEANRKTYWKMVGLKSQIY